MKKKIVVKITWTTRSPLKIATKARTTVTSMSGNAGFPTPKVTVVVMAAAATRVEIAYANRKNGSVAKDELTNSCIALDGLLHLQADYVNGIANGDPTIIHSAGFESTANVDSVAKVAKPVIVNAPILTSVSGGNIKAKIYGITNTQNYCFVLVIDGDFKVSINKGQIGVEEGTKVVIINSTKSTVLFTDLPVLKSVKVAVVASNATGDSGFTPVAVGSTIQ